MTPEAYEDEITCPYCKHQYSDSWEYGEDGIESCEECNKSFRYSKVEIVRYATTGIEEQEIEAHER